MFIVPLQPPVAYTLVSPSDAVALLKCTILCPKAERNEQFFSEVIIVPVKEFEIRVFEFLCGRKSFHRLFVVVF